MALARRFLFYFIGIGLGILFVYAVVLRGRDWPAWLPQGAVIEEIFRKPMTVTEDETCSPQALGIDSLQLNRMIKKSKVDFKRSDVQKQPCRLYYLNTEWIEKNYEIEVSVCDSSVVVECVRVSMK